MTKAPQQTPRQLTARTPGWKDAQSNLTTAASPEHAAGSRGASGRAASGLLRPVPPGPAPPGCGHMPAQATHARETPRRDGLPRGAPTPAPAAPQRHPGPRPPSPLTWRQRRRQRQLPVRNNSRRATRATARRLLAATAAPPGATPLAGGRQRRRVRRARAGPRRRLPRGHWLEGWSEDSETPGRGQWGGSTAG